MNERENNFDENFNDNNYKKTFMKLHDDDWRNIFFTSADVDMLVHGCGVSQYPTFYYRQLEKYQLLTRPYLGVLKVIMEKIIIK